jgi:Asp-tRNA(Asn)/Glu-tRNA(Gln) amidotransferase B subunit
VIGLEVHVQLDTRTKLLLWRAAGTLGMIVDEVIAGNPQQVEQYKTEGQSAGILGWASDESQ